MPRTVKDVVYLDTNETEAAPSTISDLGDGSFPQVSYGRDFLIFKSSATSLVNIPWGHVVKITETTVAS